MRVVLDTDVFVGAFLSPQGPSAQILKLVLQEAFELLLSAEIANEYALALRSKHVKNAHKLSDTQIIQAVEDLKSFATLVMPAYGAPATDPDRDKFFACALAGGAQFVISGNTNGQRVNHYHGVELLSPVLVLALLSQLGVLQPTLGHAE